MSRFDGQTLYVTRDEFSQMLEVLHGRIILLASGEVANSWEQQSQVAEILGVPVSSLDGSWNVVVKGDQS